MEIDDILKIFDVSSIAELTQQLSDSIADELIKQIPNTPELSEDTARFIAAATGIAVVKSLENTLLIVNYALEKK